MIETFRIIGVTHLVCFHRLIDKMVVFDDNSNLFDFKGVMRSSNEFDIFEQLFDWRIDESMME
jgi:hypothetical protein